MTAQERVNQSITEANEGHGRFSCWSNGKTLELKLDSLRALVNNTADMKLVGDIELVVREAEAHRGGARDFTCWAGPRAAFTTTITVLDLRVLIYEARQRFAKERTK